MSRQPAEDWRELDEQLVAVDGKLRIDPRRFGELRLAGSTEWR